jgi:hypothetical protein
VAARRYEIRGARYKIQGARCEIGDARQEVRDRFANHVKYYVPYYDRPSSEVVLLIHRIELDFLTKTNSVERMYGTVQRPEDAQNGFMPLL